MLDDIQDAETREDKFRRIAKKRGDGILDSLRGIRQVLTSPAYTFDEDQKEALLSALEEELRIIRIEAEETLRKRQGIKRRIEL